MSRLIVPVLRYCRAAASTYCGNTFSLSFHVPIINHYRSYAHQFEPKVDTPSKVIKKIRARKQKITKESAKTKLDSLNVYTVVTAEEYDLEALYSSFLHNDKYEISNVFNRVCNEDMNFDFIHVKPIVIEDEKDSEIYFFRTGSFVAWNVPQVEVDNITNFVENFEIKPYDKIIAKNEQEEMPYIYTNDNKNSVLRNGNICLIQKSDMTSLHKYTYSNGMACSVKLGIWESILQDFIDGIEPLTVDLKKGHRIRICRSELLKKTGELYSLKHKINLSSDLLDTPDFYWERDDLEDLYLNTCRYFNIPRRTKVINDKINHCIELLDLLSAHLSDRHHIRLEWMIIILIMVEVGFEILHYTNSLQS